MKKLDYKSGQYIFKAGDKGKEIFLLMSGDIGLFLPTNDTKEPNFMIGENEVFGEMGVIEHKPRMASARCMSDATVIALSESEFEDEIMHLSRYEIWKNRITMPFNAFGKKFPKISGVIKKVGEKIFINPAIVRIVMSGN